METMIVGRVLEQEAAVKQVSVGEGTWESGIRTFLVLLGSYTRSG